MKKRLLGELLTATISSWPIARPIDFPGSCHHSEDAKFSRQRNCFCQETVTACDPAWLQTNVFTFLFVRRLIKQVTMSNKWALDSIFFKFLQCQITSFSLNVSSGNHILAIAILWVCSHLVSTCSLSDHKYTALSTVQCSSKWLVNNKKKT